MRFDCFCLKAVFVLALLVVPCHAADGPAPVTPRWSCEGLQGSTRYTIEINFYQDKAHVTEGTRRQAFAARPIPIRNANYLFQMFHPTPNDTWPKALGFTESFVEIDREGRRTNFALSVYLEKKLANFSRYERDDLLYSGRAKFRMNGNLVGPIELKCKYDLPSVQSDPVDFR